MAGSARQIAAESRSMHQPKQRTVDRMGKFGPLMVSTLRQERKSYRAETAVAHGEGLLIASYNVHKCVGTDGRFDPGRILSVIREINADVIALQEADERFGERAALLDLESLKRQSGLAAVRLPVPRKGHGWHGNVVLARDAEVTATHQIALPGVEPRGALMVDLTLPAGPLRVIAAHLGLLRRSRAQQVEALLSAAQAKDTRPTLLMGDLNEWRLGRRSSLLGLHPVFGPLHASVPSFPSRFPVWALDRVLANPHHLVSSVEIHDTPLARVASDHLPIKARINLNAMQEQTQAA